MGLVEHLTIRGREWFRRGGSAKPFADAGSIPAASTMFPVTVTMQNRGNMIRQEYISGNRGD